MPSHQDLPTSPPCTVLVERHHLHSLLASSPTSSLHEMGASSLVHLDTLLSARFSQRGLPMPIALHLAGGDGRGDLLGVYIKDHNSILSRGQNGVRKYWSLVVNWKCKIFRQGVFGVLPVSVQMAIDMKQWCLARIFDRNENVCATVISPMKWPSSNTSD